MTPDWQALEGQFPPAAVRLLRDRFQTPGSFSVTVRDLAQDSKSADRDAEALLEAFVTAGTLTKQTYLHCVKCGADVSGDDQNGDCHGCGTAFIDEVPSSVVRYQLDREAPRDVPWVLVLHGMNTRGTWQEELTWLIARSYKRMVPVAIYKYGVVRPGVLFRWRQRAIVRRVITKFVELSKQARDAGFDGAPDVIAHSFGTWLIAHALDDRRVRVGRLILLGSIVPPDFEWAPLVAGGRVGMVLNHGATNDFWVKVSQYGIPDSGPGGRVGYPEPVLNVAASGLGHSDYFAPEQRMRELFAGVWQPFLRWESVPPFDGAFKASPWRGAPSLVRIATRLLAISLVGCIMIAFVLIFACGLWCLLR
jgi:pimeloyl-ACP methyl ester carboxylesterase